jgi:hypothetical protein
MFACSQRSRFCANLQLPTRILISDQVPLLDLKIGVHQRE